MGAEQIILCGGVAGGRGESAALPLRIYGPNSNVSLSTDDLAAGLYTRHPPAFADLIDVATYVYAADQAVPRAGAGDGNFGANWRRSFIFRVPVREPDLWRSPDVNDALVSTLSFLSEDEYRFEFVSAAGLVPPPAGMFDFGSTMFDGVVEEVVLFSGGLDSLAGAVREAVTDTRRVLLVNHRSNPKPGPRHVRLAQGLTRHAGDARPFLLRMRINKDSGLTRETTQRSRSFLYATLGAAYARLIGLPRVRFYENGVVSMNLPIGRQVVGARATRTTHPRVLAGFTRLFTALAGRPLAVENPFVSLTKTDVVRSIVEAGCADLIADTVSCVETHGRSNLHPHCGVCSQCIDRRFAVLAAGATANDPSTGYEVDLLTGERADGESRTLLASYLDLANRVERMTQDEFAARFGELGRVLRCLPGSAESALTAVYALYRRHAEQVNRVIDRELAAAAMAGRFRDPNLSPRCLIRLMTDAGEPPPDSAPTEPSPDNVFQRRGQVYVVKYAGGPENILLPSKGAAYLNAILSRSGGTTSAPALASQIARRRNQFGLGDAGGRLDKETLGAYRERLVELRTDIDQAKADNDFGRQQRAEEELVWLSDEVRQSTDIQGKIRTESSDREKVRKAVTVAIGRAINDIQEFDPVLADHLTTHIERGNSLRYTHDGTPWLT